MARKGCLTCGPLKLACSARCRRVNSPHASRLRHEERLLLLRLLLLLQQHLLPQPLFLLLLLLLLLKHCLLPHPFFLLLLSLLLLHHEELLLPQVFCLGSLLLGLLLVWVERRKLGLHRHSGELGLQGGHLGLQPDCVGSGVDSREWVGAGSTTG